MALALRLRRRGLPGVHTPDATRRRCACLRDKRRRQIVGPAGMDAAAAGSEGIVMPTRTEKNRRSTRKTI